MAQDCPGWMHAAMYMHEGTFDEVLKNSLHPVAVSVRQPLIVESKVHVTRNDIFIHSIVLIIPWNLKPICSTVIFTYPMNEEKEIDFTTFSIHHMYLKCTCIELYGSFG